MEILNLKTEIESTKRIMVSLGAAFNTKKPLMYEYGNGKFIDLRSYYRVLRTWEQTKVTEPKKKVDYENNKIYLQHSSGSVEIDLFNEN